MFSSFSMSKRWSKINEKRREYSYDCKGWLKLSNITGSWRIKHKRFKFFDKYPCNKLCKRVGKINRSIKAFSKTYIIDKKPKTRKLTFGKL